MIAFASPPDSIPVYHKVKRGETTASVAKKYHLEKAAILKWNRLRSAKLGIGQILIIGYVKHPVQAIVSDDSTSVVTSEKTNSTELTLKQKEGEVSVEGFAFYTDKMDANKEKYYALHNEAPIGAIIRLEYAPTKKFVYVKVIGRITEDYPSDNNIIVTRIVAQKLGVLEQDFECKLSYAKE